MHDDDDSDRRETGSGKEKILAGIFSFSAVVLAALGSSLAFLSDVSARFAVMDSRILATQSDTARLEKAIELLQTDVRAALNVDHVLSERITKCEMSRAK